MKLNRQPFWVVTPLAVVLLITACRSAPSQPTSAPQTSATSTQASATQAATEQTSTAPAQEPTIVPTLAAPTAGTSAPQSADDLARVKEAGKLLVGLSADYPPYESYNAQFKIDGFDVALINDLGKRLGVAVDINDFAFEGLLSALQLGQVDAVISAISVTPERQQTADFTNVYFIGADALLARSDYPTNQIQTLSEVAGRKIGAQKGSVYATFLQGELVDKGLTNANDVFLYADTDSAIKDLQAKRIDLVMLDRLPAQSFANTAGLKVVGENFNPQQFAIAVREGSNLRQALNDALLSAQNDGTVTRLIGAYLNLESGDVEPVPTPTPGPQPTAVPQPTATSGPPPCVAGMSYVADLNYDDQNMTAPPVFQPGQPFTKGWRVRNSGNCNWAADYTLRYVFGNTPAARMGGTAIAVGQAIASGATADLSVNLVAPSQPGTYQGFWQMYDSGGTPFGERVWVGITVPAPPTPTQAPQPTPVPGIGFNANPTTINQGQCTTFNWNVQGVSGVWFYPQGAPYQNYGVAGVSSSQQCPASTTTYELRVQFNNGAVQVQQITIYVNPPVGPGPIINSFNVQPASINPGGCVSLNWNISGNTTRVALTRNGQAIYDGAPLVGAISDCPPSLPGQTIITYALQAFDTNNQVVQTTRQVTVSGGGGLPPSGNPTPAP